MARTRGVWGPLNLVLTLLLALVLVALAILIARGAEALPGSTPAERRAADTIAVRKAAEREAVAFVTLDYRDPEPQVDAVLAGATGSFHKDFAAGRDRLVADAKRDQVRSTGRVVSAAVGTMGEMSATVLVAANAKVQNRGVVGPLGRAYRFRLHLVKVGDAWRTDRLEFVS